MRKIASVLIVSAAVFAGAALPVSAHVTPNVELVKKGEFIQQSLAGASRFFEEKLAFSPADRSAVRQATGWVPSEEDARVYVGRDGAGRRVGTAVLLWMPSQHGPLAVAVAFGPEGKVVKAAVTDVGSEPLAWVRPLIDAGGLAAFAGLELDGKPDPAKVTPQVTGAMNRYYAEVIAQAIGRAQALERVSLAAGR
jgi:hypothetical protein